MSQDSGYGSGEKIFTGEKKKHTQLYDLLGNHFHPYITNKIIHNTHHPYDFQINKGPHNLFALCATKHRTNSKTMNMTTRFLRAIDDHICGYKYVFIKLYSNLGMYISE